MTTRQWLPSDYMDEMVPPLRATPQDWIMPHPNGGWCLDDAEEFMGDDEKAGARLEEGQTLAFHYRIDLADGTLTVTDDDDGDRAWTVDFDVSIKAPAGTDLTVWGGGDELWPSLQEAAGDLGAGSHSVSVYAWSSESVQFVYINGKLEPLNA